MTARKRTIEYAKPFCVGDLTKRKRARIGLQLVSPQVRVLTTLFFSGHSVLDPAAGAGAFLVPAVKRMLKGLGPCSPAFAVQILATPIRGFELDPFEAYLGRIDPEDDARRPGRERELDCRKACRRSER